jgi:hypothetical protein
MFQGWGTRAYLILMEQDESDAKFTNKIEVLADQNGQ